MNSSKQCNFCYNYLIDGNLVTVLSVRKWGQKRFTLLYGADGKVNLMVQQSKDILWHSISVRRE